MEKKLFIVAGPNGAGKSSFGKIIIGEEVPFFNGDVVLKDYMDRNPKDTSADAMEHAQTVFEGHCYSSVDDKKPFAYETNFMDGNAMTTSRYFKAHGYKTHMVYFAMASVKQCEERVSHRFNNNIGHDVDKENIKKNYEIGTKKLEIYHKEFDKLTIYDNSIVGTSRFPRKLVEMEKGKCTFVSSNVPKWFEKVFPDLDKEIKSQKNTEVKKNKGFSM